MFARSRHVPEPDLLRHADPDLPAYRRRRLQAHLAACAVCRARLADLEQSLTAAATPWRELPPASAARARLGARLAELSAEPRPARPLAPAAALAAVAALSLTLAWLPGRFVPSLASSGSGDEAVFLRPDVSLTPGVATAAGAAEVCGSAPRRTGSPIPAAVKQRVFDSYGADLRRSAEYELDYLITPELGGTADPGNLWPQPFARTAWNAYVKDELELHLQRLVCAGQLELRAAQREMAADWIGAYRRHFQTDRPRRDYVRFPLTARDGALLRAELEERGESPRPDAAGTELLARLHDTRRPEWTAFPRPVR